MNALTRNLKLNPAIGLGVAVTIGLALGTGALTDLLPFGRPAAPVQPETPASGSGGPMARTPTSDVARRLDALDQEV